MSAAARFSAKIEYLVHTMDAAQGARSTDGDQDGAAGDQGSSSADHRRRREGGGHGSKLPETRFSIAKR
ncbi:hypothetical protein [Mesorhizobium sp. J428]|uniref:hypothetical protein n=1 Tax=Mesorhizobium sp. J428 TaxID=2898440 RepID=UPI002151F12C|nr:hypothetical protein [Mesorhizobium sp. J428]MCR5857691.1 hypothetical protein [Mesorhizobium sp. J428]